MEHKVDLTGAYKRILRTEIEFAQSVVRDLPENRQLFLTLMASPYINEAAREYIMQLSPYTTTSDTTTSADILEFLQERLQELSEQRTIYEMEIYKTRNLEMC